MIEQSRRRERDCQRARLCALRGAIAAVALCVGGSWAAAAAQTDLASVPLDALLDLEVSGASKFSLRVSESPTSATVITAEQIRALGFRTLADVLRSVRGVVVSSDRTYSYLGVRGFSTPGDLNTRVLLLIDGNRVNDTIYDQAFLGSEFPLDIDLVEQVEFIPGQGSAVHGANALFGVINVVTRKPGLRSSNEASVALGSGGARQLRVTTSRVFSSDSSLLLSATAGRMTGTDAYFPAFDTPATNNGISHHTDHERGRQLYAKYERGELSGTLIHADRTKGLSGLPDYVFNDPRNLYRDTETLADLSWQRRVDALNRWKLRLYTGSYSFRGDFIVDYPPVTLNRDIGESRWWGVETLLLTERYERHKVVVGADLQYSPHRDQANVDVDPPVTYQDDRRSGRRYALFVEDQWALSPRLSLTAGLRFDHVYDSKSQFSPRIAVVGRPRDGVVLKYVHGAAFRPANAYESYYTIPGPAGYKANPALQPERVRGDEVVLELRPTAASRWTLSAYVNRASNLIAQVIDPADGLLVFNNVGSLRARGVEVEAEHVWQNGVQLRANASVQSVDDSSGQGIDARNAQRLGKLIAVLPVRPGWTLGVESIAVSERGVAPGYGLTNLNLASTALLRNTVISLGVYDVFDRQPDDLGSGSVLQPTSPQDGRSVRLKLDLKF